MLDPFLPNPPLLSVLAEPIAKTFNLTTLPLHIHEVLLAFTFYHLINSYVSPYVSRRLFPSIYPTFNKRTKLNWDVHAVSLVQSCLINVLAMWVMWTDEERSEMDWRGRVWGYTGAGGMIQGFAAGYFLWDLCVSTMHVNIFGWGMLAHAIAALVVFSLGFRPFVNFYAPTFILYELSSPFLNIHWFLDKLHRTGSRLQLYNGILLLVAFFGCRLVWGTYQSIRVYQDVWAAIQTPGPTISSLNLAHNSSIAIPKSYIAENDIMRFEGEGFVPVWLACTYLSSNIVLNTLNFYWFGKMIETVKKRFQPEKGKGNGTIVVHTEGVEAKYGEKVDETESSEETTEDIVVDGSGKASVEVEKTEVRRRRG